MVRFPDGYTLSDADCGWTQKNRDLYAQGHDVWANDYDVVIHFQNCRLCQTQRERLAQAEEAAYWDSEFEHYMDEQEFAKAYGAHDSDGYSPDRDDLPFE